MIYNLTENQSYDLTFLESYQASTAGNKVTFHKELSAQDIIDIEAHFNEMTQAERDLASDKVKAIDGIDREAGKARKRFISEGDLVDQEYLYVLSESEAYKSAGYPVSPVPPSVQSWLDNNDKGLTTATQAADDIIATWVAWKTVLEGIREARLAGKQAVRDAVDSKGVKDAEKDAKTALKAIKP